MLCRCCAVSIVTVAGLSIYFKVMNKRASLGQLAIEGLPGFLYTY